MKSKNTEKEFITAFWHLYEKKPIEKISINQLAITAGYNRATFYNHFEDIYALFHEAVHEILLPLKTEVLSIHDFRMLFCENRIEKILFNCLPKQDKYIELLFKRHDFYVLGEFIKEEILSMLSQENLLQELNLDKICVLLEYHLSAVLGTINYWYQQGRTISETELLQTICTISSKGVFSCIKNELYID